MAFKELARITLDPKQVAAACVAYVKPRLADGEAAVMQGSVQSVTLAVMKARKPKAKKAAT